MKRKFFACMAVLAGAGLCAGAAAAEIEGVIGNRSDGGMTVSFLPKNENAARQARIYIDTDGTADTGFVIGTIGADYKYENGKLYLYVGNGKTQEWEVLEARATSKTNKGRVSVFLPSRALEISKTTPLKAAVAQGDEVVQTLDITWQMAGREEAPCKRTGKMVEYFDPAGDASPGCRIDFIKMFVKPHPTKADTLMFGFTSDFPIDRANLSHHLRLMFRIGEGRGADVNGETFNYMYENNRVYRFVGNDPKQWKWTLLGRVPSRFTKQWCEIDIPLAVFKLKTMPESIKFRFSCELDDFIPDLRYAMPEYRVK